MQWRRFLGEAASTIHLGGVKDLCSSRALRLGLKSRLRRKVLKTKRSSALLVQHEEALYSPRCQNGIARPSESDAAMQNQLLTETIPKQAYSPPTTTQKELAAEETQTTQNTQAVHDWLAKIQQKAHRDKMLFWGFFAFFQMFIFIPIALTSVLPLIRNGHFNLMVVAMLCLPSFGIAALALRFALRKPSWNAEEMTRIGGVQAVGALLELLGTPKRPKQLKPLFVALIHLLPQMKASDAGLLTTGQRKLLYTLLKNGQNMFSKPDLMLTFRLAILKALEQIGDTAAIPVVARLANGQARTTDQKALKAAALDCLPLLQVNFGGVEATKTLLRASTPENAAPETLLRPAEFTLDENPEQLLHAADTPAALPPAA